MRYYADTGPYPAGINIGIIAMDARVPYPPGSPNNAQTMDYPVTYEVLRDAKYESLIYNPQFEDLKRSFLRAGQDLVERGVKAVVGSCGFMVLFQRELADALPVPVYSSSLLQMPMIAQSLGTNRKIGILTFNGPSLTDKHMEIATSGLDIQYVVRGLENCPSFYETVHGESGVLDIEVVEAELVAEAEQMVRDNRDVAAILLECTDLPPYAAAIGKATGLPVYDIMTLVDWVHRSVQPKKYPRD